VLDIIGIYLRASLFLEMLIFLAISVAIVITMEPKTMVTVELKVGGSL
jgi:hypothetical protein